MFTFQAFGISPGHREGIRQIVRLRCTKNMRNGVHDMTHSDGVATIELRYRHALVHKTSLNQENEMQNALSSENYRYKPSL